MKKYLKPITIILLLGVLFVSFFYFEIQYKKPENVDNTNIQPIVLTHENKIDTLVDSKSNKEPELSGALQGYYYSFVRTGEYMDESFNEKCEGFVVRTGDENGIKLKQYFIDHIKSGNTVNHLTEKGELILNLNSKNIDALSFLEKEILRKSSSTDEVIIYVKKIPEGNTEAPPCYSFVNLYQVDDYQFD